MTKFYQALYIMEHGGKVRRRDWNRPAYVHFTSYPTSQCMEMVMKSGTRGPYTPSQCDIFADDWHAIGHAAPDIGPAGFPAEAFTNLSEA